MLDASIWELRSPQRHDGHNDSQRDHHLLRVAVTVLDFVTPGNAEVAEAQKI